MNSENSNSSLSKLLAESLASGEKFNYAKFNKKSTEKGGRGNKLLKFTYSNNDHEGSFEKVCERFRWRFILSFWMGIMWSEVYNLGYRR